MNSACPLNGGEDKKGNLFLVSLQDFPKPLLFASLASAMIMTSGPVFFAKAWFGAVAGM